MNEIQDTSSVFPAAASTTRDVRRKLQDILKRLTAMAGELFPDRARQELQSVSQKFQGNLFYLVFLGQLNAWAIA
ncbi:MAG: hypothetical protein HY313_09460 [Acidobacteria bacterium]|nr:hypothetical protein [Acidobacteriota bacterium]